MVYLHIVEKQSFWHIELNNIAKYLSKLRTQHAKLFYTSILKNIYVLFPKNELPLKNDLK